MAEYVTPEIEQDPAAIREQMIDDLAADGIEVRPATPTYYLLAVFAFLWAQLAEQASQVFSTIFRYFGEKIVRLQPRSALAAATTVTFTAVDDDGPYEIPTGTEVNLRGADGAPVAFRTQAPATVPNGSTTVTPVTVVAATPGTTGNGLSTLVAVTQTFTWLDSVTVLEPSDGGADAETDSEFQDRLADELTFPLRTLARPVNFETYARNFPGVSRALAVNNLPAPGYIKVFVELEGDTVSAPAKAALLDNFQELSLLNLIPLVDDPTFTTVNVAFVGKAKAGHDPAEVQAATESAVLGFLNPANWGRPQDLEFADIDEWEEQLIVRHQDVSHVLNSVDGFDYWTALTINGVAGDFTLTGPAALPDLDSTAAGTITAP